MDGETATLELTQETQQQENPQQESTQSTEQQQQQKPDGRQRADAVRKALKFLRDNKDHAATVDGIGRDLSDVAAYRKFFEKVGNAREVSQALSSIGGFEKLAELQTYSARMRDVDERLENGDPSVVDDILETGATGILKIMPHMIERLQQSNPREMGEIAQPLARSFMESEGLPDAIDAMVNAFNDKNLKPEEKLREISRFLSGVVNWYKGLGGKDGARPDPDRERFEQERSTWNQERYETAIGDVFNGSDGIMAYAQRKIDARLLNDAKKMGISQDKDYIDLLRNDIWKIIEKSRNGDAFFKADRDSKFNGRTKKVSEDAKSWMNGFTDKYFEAAYKQVMGPRLKTAENSTKGATKTSPTAAPSNAAPVLDTQATIMKAGGRDRAQDMILAGKGFTKDGKAIKKVGRAWQFA